MGNKTDRTLLSSAACTAIFVLILASWVMSQEKEREYTEYERERFELDLKFEAVVLMDDGEKFSLTGFHIGEGLLRHKLETGDEQSGLLLPMSNIKRIVRSRDTKDWVTVVFKGGVEMSTRWKDYQVQKLFGTLDDGSQWSGLISQVREVEIRQMKTSSDESR